MKKEKLYSLEETSKILDERIEKRAEKIANDFILKNKKLDNNNLYYV